MTDWMTCTEGYPEHGPHLPKVLPACQELLWLPASWPEGRRRELRWTCRCKAVRYSLYSSPTGGFIARHGPGAEVAHTQRMPHTQAGAMWGLLLTGRAR